MKWSNEGVGRAMRDAHLVMLLDDRTVEGGTIPSARWVKGKSHEVAKSIDHDLPPGEYQVRFYLEDRKYNQRIALPLKGGDGNRAYPLGRIRVTER